MNAISHRAGARFRILRRVLTVLSGLVLTAPRGFADTSYVIYNHLWVLKTDSRGRPAWESSFDAEPTDSCNEQGWSIVRAHDTGYLIAGTVRTFGGGGGADAVLQQVDEDGAAIGAMQRIGAEGVNEDASCLIATDAGGYAMLGTSPVGGVESPWLVEIAPDGAITEHTYPYTHQLRGIWLTPVSGGGYALATQAYGNENCVIITDASGAETWNQETSKYGDQHWIGPTETVPGGFIVVGRQDRNIVMRFHDSEGAEVGDQQWSGTNARGYSRGYHATGTIDGGHLITGEIVMEDRAGASVVLIKTDAAGTTHWMDADFGSPEVAARGIATIALDDGSYVVLGRLESGDSRCWLFKIAANHPPVADLQVPSPIAWMGAPISFDATGSTDRDGTVSFYEWDFGDGPTIGPGSMDHVFDEPGGHEVEVTVVDDVDGEGTASMTVVVLGARVVGNGSYPFVIEEQSQSEDPGEEPGVYPKPGSPPLLDWEDALGFHLVGSSSASTTRTFRVTFAQVLSPEFIMYRLPDWTPVPFTLIDEHTVEVHAHTPSGEVAHTYVFSGTVPTPGPPDIASLPDAKLSLTFTTYLDVPYRIQHSVDLDPEGWNGAGFGLTAEGPYDVDVLTGSGGEVTVYLEQPSDPDAFYRLQLGDE